MANNTATAQAKGFAPEYDEELLKRERKANSAWSKLRRNKTAMVGLIIVVVMILLAVCAPLYTQITGFQFDKIDPVHGYLEPGTVVNEGEMAHILGTDKLGRDLLCRLLYGARTSLIVAFGGTIVAGLIGALLGLIAGFFGGWVDSLIMRIMDGMLSFPFILLAIILMTVLGSGLFNVILARVLRGEVIIVKNAEYCNAARVLGVSNARMLFTHILPNAISPLIVYATLGIAGAIISEAALSFLGLGITEPTPSWGQILYSGKDVMSNHPIISTVSGIFILVTVLGFNLLGDGIRDVMDPKMKK